MATYVLDTSIVIEGFVQGAYSNHVQNLFARLGNPDQMIVPEFCLIECTNVIWKHVRFQGMSTTQAEQIVQDLIDLPLHRFPVKKLMPVALRIGVQHQLAVYDSMYIALAQRIQAPIITVDTRQSQTAQTEGIQLKSIEDF